MNTTKILVKIDQYIESKNFLEAIKLCDKLLSQKLAPEEVLLRRASIEYLNENLEQVIHHLNKALKQNPTSLQILQSLGAIHEKIGNINEAKDCFERAFSLEPNSYNTLKDLAFFLYDHGYSSSAREKLKLLILIFPFNATAHFAYSRTGTYKRADIVLQHLQKAIDLFASLETIDKIKLGFTLGKANHDIKEYRSAFNAYSGANKLHAKYRPADSNHDIKLLDDVQTLFGHRSPWPLAQWQQPHRTDYPTPIFIVGMPRTGSTLLEQMLGSHSNASAAGELNFLYNSIEKNLIGEYKSFRGAAPHWTPDSFAKTATDYLENIAEIGGNSAYIIDKMPGNFAFLGIIHLLFPSAKVVITKRNAMDVVWSNFTTLFGDNLLLYTYDLDSITNQLIAHERATDYWTKFLTHEQVKINSHENLIDQPEEALRALLSFIEMPWEDGCLNYQNNNIKIRTASHIQVKKPLNKSGIGRWKNYSEHLQHISKLLIEADISV